jgi:hypothetical protein
MRQVVLVTAAAMIAFTIVFMTCPAPKPVDSDAGIVASTAAVQNLTDAGVTVYASFGTADGAVGPDAWATFCAPTPSGCSFGLDAGALQVLPTSGQYLNLTLSFGAPPGCGTTLGELDLANPQWNNDTANISLVNGFNQNVEILVSNGQTLGPTQGGDANADIYGVYPIACDICVARDQPPCGVDAAGCTLPGSCGCKSGSQYNPNVPCQESFTRGAAVTVAVVP